LIGKISPVSLIHDKVGNRVELALWHEAREVTSRYAVLAGGRVDEHLAHLDLEAGLQFPFRATAYRSFFNAGVS
jgi:hypothetical protein